MDRLPWWDRRTSRCQARLDNGNRCELQPHKPDIAHAHVDGEVTTRWSVVTWTDRTVGLIGQEGK